MALRLISSLPDTVAYSISELTASYNLPKYPRMSPQYKTPITVELNSYHTFIDHSSRNILQNVSCYTVYIKLYYYGIKMSM